MGRAKGHRAEPGLLRIFRYFSGGVSLAFLVLRLLPSSVRTENAVSRKAMVLFAVTYGAIFVYLVVPRLESLLKGFYLPPALMAVSLIPIAITNAKYQALLSMGLPINNLGDTMTLTILLIFPLFLTAWQYSFPIVFLFFVVLGLLDPILLVLVNESLPPEIYAAFNTSLIRILSLGAVGFMITELRSIQRAERRELEEANRKLEEYARTAEQLAVSRERNRLARDLHDTLAHTLSGVSVNLEALKTLIDPGQTEVLAGLDKSLKAVRSGLNDTRRALKDLRPRALEDLGLALALQEQAQAVANRAGLELHCAIEEVQLSAFAEQNLYRIAQEALQNVAAHAQAKHLHVELGQVDGCITLRIHDDGLGFDRRQVDSSESFGLTGMQERAAIIGASLEVSSQRTKGTLIQVRLEVESD